jgi:signal peptidase I
VATLSETIQVSGGQVSINGEKVKRTRVGDFLMPVSPNSPCRTVYPAKEKIVTDANGNALCAYPRYRETLPGGRSYFVLDQVSGPGDDTDPIVVPQGDYFVMGDNRDDSLDSRFPVSSGGVGLLPAEDLVGRALVTFFSTDGTASYLLPWTWFSAARWDRIGATY